MSDAIKHITDDIFFLSGKKHICAHALCLQHSPTASALSTSFLLNHAPNIPELNAFTRLRESYSSVSISRKSWELRTRRSCLVIADTADTTVVYDAHDRFFYLLTKDLAPFLYISPQKTLFYTDK